MEGGIYLLVLFIYIYAWVMLSVNHLAKQDYVLRIFPVIHLPPISMLIVTCGKERAASVLVHT